MQEAFQWILRVKNRYQIRILNISVGIGELKERYKEQVLREYMELLWDHNILVVCAAGNAGPEDGSISESVATYHHKKLYNFYFKEEVVTLKEAVKASK